MSLIICPVCNQPSELVEAKENEREVKQECPHCGAEIIVDLDLNIVRED